MIWSALIAFGAMAVMDIAYVFYTRAVVKESHLAAGGWAAGMPVIQGILVFSYVHAPLTILAAAAGAFLGTYTASRWLR